MWLYESILDGHGKLIDMLKDLGLSLNTEEAHIFWKSYSDLCYVDWVPIGEESVKVAVDFYKKGYIDFRDQ